MKIQEHKKLRDEIVKKFSDNFVEKLGKNDRSKCKPITLEKDQRKLAEMKPVSHMKPFDVPFHLREAACRNPTHRLEYKGLPCDQGQQCGRLSGRGLQGAQCRDPKAALAHRITGPTFETHPH